MCNSSLQINKTAFILDESMDWFCICEGHFGPFFIFLTSILCFIVGTPIHCWSLWMFLHGNIKPNLVFPLILTIVELFFCIQCIIDVTVITYPSLMGDRLANFLIGFSWTFRPFIQICMCVEQYLAVIHPVIFLRYKDIHYRIALVAAAGLIALCNSLRLVIGTTSYFKDHAFFAVFCIAVLITSICCASVLHALKRPGPGDRNNKDQNKCNKTDKIKAAENQQKRKAFRIISHILVSILLCYLPMVVTYFINIASISRFLYLCEVVPLTLSVTGTAVLLSPLLRMYNDGHLKPIVRFLKLRGQIKEK